MFYEYGTFTINTNVLSHSQTQIRVVTFVWLQNILESIGFGGKFAWAAPPLAVIIILLSLQITSRKKWNFWVKDFFLMIVECSLLAVPLIVLALFLSFSSTNGTQRFHSKMNNPVESQNISVTVCSSVNGNNITSSDSQQNQEVKKKNIIADIVTGIGAGIYEELVFRLILICILLVLFQDLIGMTHANAIVFAVLVSAALFSAHHHVDLLSGRPSIVNPFNVTKFAFRTIAGVYFSILYAIRGFGITAGTHAFYNIFAVTITAEFFPHY